MSLERALEENTAALREFTAYMKLAMETASVENAKQQTRAWDAKAKLDNEEIAKWFEESRAAMHAEMAEEPLPVIEAPLPVIEAPLPVIEAPVVKAKKPVAEAPPKVTAAALPVIETEVPHTLASVGLAMVTAAKLDRARVVRILAEFGAVRVCDLSY